MWPCLIALGLVGKYVKDAANENVLCLAVNRFGILGYYDGDSYLEAVTHSIIGEIMQVVINLDTIFAFLATLPIWVYVVGYFVIGFIVVRLVHYYSHGFNRDDSGLVLAMLLFWPVVVIVFAFMGLSKAAYFIVTFGQRRNYY